MSGTTSIFGLHNSDVRELRAYLENQGHYKEFVDTTITSPPYFDVQSYGYKNQIGYGQEYSRYLGNLGEIFREIYNVTKNTGSLWIIVDTIVREGKLIDLPHEISKQCVRNRWILTNMLIWKKNKTRPWPKKGLRNIFEYVLFFTKSNRFKFFTDRIRTVDVSQLKQWWVEWPERYNPKGMLPTNVWEFPIPTQGNWSGKSIRHFNPLPPKMIERMLLLSTDLEDVVLDPFSGSGTVLAVADSMDRRWFGFEMNKEYCNMFGKTVLKEIREELLVERKRNEEITSLRAKFEETIKNLRLVKFPKSLVRQAYRNKILDTEKHPLNTLFVISKTPTKQELALMTQNKFMIEDIYFIFSQNIDTEVLEEKVKEIAVKDPLSHFGIEPKVVLLSKDRFASRHRNLFNNRTFWLYVNGVVHKFERGITFSEWLNESTTPQWREFFENGIPPIIINAKVYQQVPKTLRTKEENFSLMKSKFEELLGITSEK